MAYISDRFLICIPRASDKRARQRFKTVGRAVIRMAELLGADIEISQRRNLLSVWVYYKNEGKEWSPIYYDWGKDWSENEVLSSIRSELYRLPRHHNIFVSQSAQTR